VVCDVEIDMATGVIRPTRFVAVLDAGPVSNPDGLKNQTEGGILQGTSRALVEEVRWDDTHVTSTDWISYPSLHLGYAIPEIVCDFLEPEGVLATGAGETAITVTPAAIGNAVFAATGVRLRDVPFTPARFLAALRQASV
jgi:nicotinate dehydrogenase subunit B